jgi:beta-glucosidase
MVVKTNQMRKPKLNSIQQFQCLLTALFMMLFVSQTRAEINTNTETRINNLIGQMTLEEKVAMCEGGGPSEFKGVPRLHLPALVVTDGPRGPHQGTAFPVGVAFGSTWNPKLIKQAATVMGVETRFTGATMLLGPGINIQRDPLNGRFFEYYTEDPFLDSQLTVAFVKGVQSQRVAACLKHFIGNEREDNRNNYMSMISQRALNEIYYPAFKAGTEDGGAWAVMTSANGVNGEFVSDSRRLLYDTLKGDWGFDGMVLTDWLGTRSTVKAALAGLDVSMPYQPNSLFGQPLLEALKDGRVPQSVLDDKVRRVLRTMDRVGLLDGIPPTQGGVQDTPTHHELSRQVAEESLVLLKNEHHTLPLDLTKLRKLLVVGPNADRRFCVIGLGGSSWQNPSYEITPLQGVRNAVGTNVEVQFVSPSDLGDFEVIPNRVLAAQNGKRGFQARYFNPDEGALAVERMEPELNFLWEMRSPDFEKVKVGNFRAEFTASIIPPVSGTYAFRVTAGAGSAWMFVDAVGGAPLAVADTSLGVPSATANVQLQAGKPFYLRVDYTKSSGDAACRLEWSLPTDAKKMSETYAKVAAAAKSADAVLVFVGIDHSLDSEGRDRTSMEFPQLQETLIRQLVRANPKTIVTLINGSPLELGHWLDYVPAVLEAWYPGMEGGNAIAAGLFGKINPSGKLPFTWPKHLADSPTHAIGTENNDRVNYLEDVFVGYRYFDTEKIEPQFPFGFGLSYTTFDFSHLKVSHAGEKVKISFDVANTGTWPGAEVAQVYVAPPAGGVNRPVHELKGFQKIFLSPGEKQTVQLELDKQSFAYFDEAKNGWVVPLGKYKIQVGDSSRNLPLNKSMEW